MDRVLECTAGRRVQVAVDVHETVRCVGRELAGSVGEVALDVFHILFADDRTDTLKRSIGKSVGFIVVDGDQIGFGEAFEGIEQVGGAAQAAGYVREDGGGGAVVHAEFGYIAGQLLLSELIENHAEEKEAGHVSAIPVFRGHKLVGVFEQVDEAAKLGITHAVGPVSLWGISSEGPWSEGQGFSGIGHAAWSGDNCWAGLSYD